MKSQRCKSSIVNQGTLCGHITRSLFYHAFTGPFCHLAPTHPQSFYQCFPHATFYLWCSSIISAIFIHKHEKMDNMLYLFIYFLRSKVGWQSYTRGLSQIWLYIIREESRKSLGIMLYFGHMLLLQQPIV